MAGRWFQPPRRVLTSFLVVVVACLATLAWLGYRLLAQDRALEGQRISERLEVAADRAAASFERRIAELEGALDGGPVEGAAGSGTLVILATSTNLETRGSVRLLFYPEPVAPPDVPDIALRRAEIVEFQGNDPLAAAALFREAARSREPGVRAAALVRLGRSLRKGGRPAEALRAYSELAALGSTPVSGLPAELVAREARCSTLEATGQGEELRREAAALLGGLEAGRWRLARSAYEFRAREARTWIGDGAGARQASEATAVSDTVATLVEEWRARPESSRGRRIFWLESQPTLAVWRATSGEFTAAVAGREYLEPLWSEGVLDRRVRLALADANGRVLVGTLPAPGARVAVRAASLTGLPWTIHVSGADLAALASDAIARRRLLLAGLSVLAVLLVVSSGFIVRAVTRELAVSRLQSEFVASVSHEFRSPLTSIRQLSSMLVQGRLPSEDQRQRSYRFLADETARLERLIEGLLDFGLTEAGEARYRLEPADARDLVRETVAAFQRTLAATICRVELSLPDSACVILADRDALGRAVWNLLDNAVKYSPGHRTVWVDVVLREGRVAIEVRDRGMGIPAAEQRAVFRKFVRGASSREAGIRGTGIGLAMVQHIVAAHGGETRLESAPGEGSRFTILIPMEAGA